MFFKNRKRVKKEETLAILETVKKMSSKAGMMATEVFIGGAMVKPIRIPYWLAYLILAIIILGSFLLAVNLK